MAIANPDNLIARAREHRRTTFADVGCASGASVDNPNFFFCAFRICLRVCVFTRLVLSLLGTASIGNRVAARRKDQIGQLATVVAVVVCQLPRREVWRFRNPDVSLAFSVEGPRYFVAAR